LTAKAKPIVVGGSEIAAGCRAIVDLPVANLYTHTQLTMPVHVVNGRHPGPTLFLTAAVHGDSLNGVEIINRVLERAAIKRLRGRLLAVPIVNVFGFINRSRYLPDRRDLNRSFPGREQGSIAARLAQLVATEIVAKANYGIDLHTGTTFRANLPQVRGALADTEVLRLATAFGTPVIIDAQPPVGSLREYATSKGVTMLLYEGGEGLRFNELAIRAGVRGVLRVLRALDMLPARVPQQIPITPVRAEATTWVRAPASGIVRIQCQLGDRVKQGQSLAIVSDPFGDREFNVVATAAGLVIGRSTSPLAHEGDALFNLARFENVGAAEALVDEFHEVNMAEDSWG
jgi:predicted deacylase